MSAAYINLLRTAAGIHSLAHLHDVQSRFRSVSIDDNGQRRKAVVMHTKRKPQRGDDLLNGGSVYWIIKHMIKARQEILDIELLTDDDGQDFCRIYLHPQIMVTHGVAHRAIQGWRYLLPEKAPRDMRPFDPADENEDEDIPEDMARELRELGLI